MSEFQVYEDLLERTGGEFYLGVCGPVRTGKSTFIKRFMELMVLPDIQNEQERNRATDELPQSSSGKTIMTTEPKFIPKQAATVRLFGDSAVKVRLVDCVGYIVNGAEGLYEGQEERMVMTPWSKQPMPFTQAAEYGTSKVIREHSTVGIVVTTDGSFSELSREAYEVAEERTVRELQEIGKPFVIIVNSTKPYSKEVTDFVEELSDKYQSVVMALNCNQLRKEDVVVLLEKILSAFPVRTVAFQLPKWVEMLPNTHWIKQELQEFAGHILHSISKISDVTDPVLDQKGEGIQGFLLQQLDMVTGTVSIMVNFDQTKYYQVLSELIGTPISGEYQLITLLKEYVSGKKEIQKMEEAWNDVHQKGYGVVTPSEEEIIIDEPELIRHGNKYGVKLRAVSPSIHLIQADIETEIAPIVGTQKQAEDLIEYIALQKQEAKDGIWETNIFGKTVRQLVEEGMEGKVHRLGEDGQQKLKDTIGKVINDGNGGLVCIII